MTLGFTPSRPIRCWRHGANAGVSDAYSEFFNSTLEDSPRWRTRLLIRSTPGVSPTARRAASVFPYNIIVKAAYQPLPPARATVPSAVFRHVAVLLPIIERQAFARAARRTACALPIIESALSPTATSPPMGVTGCGAVHAHDRQELRGSKSPAGRRAPRLYLATQAACRYLKDPYAIYNDWTSWPSPPTTAARNVTALSPAREARIWEEVYDHLPRETRAAMSLPSSGRRMLMPTTSSIGIEPTEAPDSLSVGHRGSTSWDASGAEIFRMIDLPGSRPLCQLNPQYKLDYHPRDDQVLPHWSRCSVMSRSTSPTNPRSTPKTRCNLKGVHQPGQPRQETPRARDRSMWSREGDTLGAIAPPLP